MADKLFKLTILAGSDAEAKQIAEREHKVEAILDVRLSETLKVYEIFAAVKDETTTSKIIKELAKEPKLF